MFAAAFIDNHDRVVVVVFRPIYYLISLGKSLKVQVGFQASHTAQKADPA